MASNPAQRTVYSGNHTVPRQVVRFSARISPWPCTVLSVEVGITWAATQTCPQHPRDSASGAPRDRPPPIYVAHPSAPLFLLFILT